MSAFDGTDFALESCADDERWEQEDRQDGRRLSRRIPGGRVIVESGRQSRRYGAVARSATCRRAVIGTSGALTAVFTAIQLAAMPVESAPTAGLRRGVRVGQCLYPGAGRSRRDRVSRDVRVVPRRFARRHQRRAAPRRAGFSQDMGRQRAQLALQSHQQRHAIGQSRLAGWAAGRGVGGVRTQVQRISGGEG